MICQLCGKNNHVLVKCYKRFHSSFHGLENPQTNSPSSNSTYQVNLTQQSSSTPTMSLPKHDFSLFMSNNNHVMDNSS